MWWTPMKPEAIMMVRLWRSQSKVLKRIQDFIHCQGYCLQTWKPQEKPWTWKRKHSSHCFVPQHFFTWGWDKKFVVFKLQLEEESDFYRLWKNKLDKNFDLTFEENRFLLSSMTAEICFKTSKKLLVHHFQSSEFSFGDWQILKLVLFHSHFF